MKYSSLEKNWIIQSNKKEFGDFYYQMKWIQYRKCEEAVTLRDSIVSNIKKNGGVAGYKDTKIDLNGISPGCKHCADGVWSCLFINNTCNASCYYCPTSQATNCKPGTNTVEFNSPEEYASYVEHFKFKGVSLSGGEPFVTFDKTLSYIKEVKKRMGDDIYIWVYTNGKLATKEKLIMLKNAGINEIRFDIGATDYSLDKVSLAIGIIDRVTVEIPSTPDNFNILKSKLKEMKEIGINSINLHQLRATPYNVTKLIERGFSFIHGPKVTVFESELNALKLIEYSLSSGINLPINYCSSVYKALFQLTGSRKRHTAKVNDKLGFITASGYSRIMFIKEETENNIAIKDFLSNYSNDLYYYESENKRFLISQNLLEDSIKNDYSCFIQYFNASIEPLKNGEDPGFFIRKSKVTDPILLDVELFNDFTAIIKTEEMPNDEPSDELLLIYKHEVLPSGLTEYF